MNFFPYIFEGFQLDFKLLFIVLFLGIILWIGASCFNEVICFQMVGLHFQVGLPHGGALVLMGEGGSKKNHMNGGGCPPCLSTIGNPDDTSFKLNIVSFSKSLPPDPPLNQLRSSRPPAACKMQNFLLTSQCPVKYKKTTTALVHNYAGIADQQIGIWQSCI